MRAVAGQAEEREVGWLLGRRIRSPSAFRLLFAQEDGHPEAVAHNSAAVVAEMLWSRAQKAAQSELPPVNTRHGRASNQRWRQRPGFTDHPVGSAEHLRWFTSTGMSRAVPLSLEALTLEIMAVHGLGVTSATALAQQSQALTQQDQGWLMARAVTPIERRPLDDTEFRQLVRALEQVHVVLRGQPDLAPNRARVEAAVGTLAGWFAEYHPSPFVDPILTGVFNRAHRRHLERRAAWAERRLALISARLAPSMHIQASTVVETTRFQARLAQRKTGPTSVWDRAHTCA